VDSGVRGVRHFGITVSHLADARHFYIDVLGCQEVAAQRSDAPYLSLTGHDGVAIDAVFARVPGSDTILEIQEYQELPHQPVPRAPGTSRAGSSHLCLEVEDLERCLGRLEEAGGVRVTDPVRIDRGINEGARAVYLRDPDGYTIELYEPPRKDNDES
jgi:catechol 2,3-dioxygenase-like lactoylglutathione lyase family enzyme